MYVNTAGPHPETAGDLLGSAGLPGAALHRPEEDGAAQLRIRLRLASHRRGADGSGAPLLQHIEPAHGQELAPLLLPVDDGRDGGKERFLAADTVYWFRFKFQIAFIIMMPCTLRYKIVYKRLRELDLSSGREPEGGIDSHNLCTSE